MSLPLPDYVDYSLTLMIEVVSSVETFMNVYRTTRDYVTEHVILNGYCSGNTESASDLVHAYYMLYPHNSTSYYHNGGIRRIAQIIILLVIQLLVK
jgi:hypothetical protein